MYTLEGFRNQGDESFKKNAGRQCTAIAAVSCAQAFLKFPKDWSRKDVEVCLEVSS